MRLLLLCLLLCACGDGEYERLKSEADWQAKVERATLPKKGELVTIRQFADGRYVIRRYDGGLKRTDIIIREDQ